MRYFTFTSVTLILASVAFAAPTAGSTAVISRDDQISPEVRAVPEDLDIRDVTNDFNLLDARKPKWEKIKVTDETGKDKKGGKIPQNEWSDYEDMAQKALYQAECGSGKVIHKFHVDGSQDPEEHFTINPSGCTGKGKGEIHVHRDGDWTQGKKGKENSGNGNP
ncbi:hypothetical protein SCAR479_00384 [Seiridium cardinale]|uniref:Uncharacterized protein n=1 Tax=Seiridium cardinale TaxID=138064 RepID=A0ABR2Y9C4_9PEZI